MDWSPLDGGALMAIHSGYLLPAAAIFHPLNTLSIKDFTRIAWYRARWTKRRASVRFVAGIGRR